MFPPGHSKHLFVPAPTLPGLGCLVSSLGIIGHASDLGHICSIFLKLTSGTQIASMIPTKRDLASALWEKH